MLQYDNTETNTESEFAKVYLSLNHYVLQVHSGLVLHYNSNE